MAIEARGIPTEEATALWQGGPDAYGQRALVTRAEGPANPCRHCLELIREGEEKLVLAYRPFEALQPYAEAGPIFLHRKPCHRYESERLPAWFRFLEPAIVRGYDARHWIRYDTGEAVAGSALEETCERILEDPTIAYVHVRSKFGCFQCRVDRKPRDSTLRARGRP